MSRSGRGEESGQEPKARIRFMTPLTRREARDPPRRGNPRRCLNHKLRLSDKVDTTVSHFFLAIEASHASNDADMHAGSGGFRMHDRSTQAGAPSPRPARSPRTCSTSRS